MVFNDQNPKKKDSWPNVYLGGDETVQIDSSMCASYANIQYPPRYLCRRTLCSLFSILLAESVRQRGKESFKFRKFDAQHEKNFGGIGNYGIELHGASTSDNCSEMLCAAQ